MARSETMSDEELPEPLPPAAQEWAQRQNPNWVPPPPFLRLLYREGVLTPGVVLRIVDASGRKIFDSALHYPTVQEVEEHIISDPPFKQLKRRCLLLCERNDITKYYIIFHIQ